ncbi:MAG: DNA gyrase C-terminal beta-propeller domain-containing protein [Sphaerochaetaceae bacterium]
MRVPVETISIQKPYASGVSVSRLRKGDSIVAIAITEAEQEEEAEE